MRPQRILTAAVIASGVLVHSVPAAAEPVPVNIEQRHANGAHIRVSGVEVTDTEVRLDVRIVNGHTEGISLNDSPRSSYVMAGGQTKLLLFPPTQNREFRIPARSTVEGRMIFMGAVPAGEPLVVVLNEKGSDREASPAPKFEIPLPGEANPARDDAKKLNADPGFGGAVQADPSRLSAPAAAPPSSMSEPTTAGESRLAPVASTEGSGFSAPAAASDSELAVIRTARGTVVTLGGDILFDFDRADVRADAEPTLARLAAMIGDSRAARVEISGHTDSKGSDAYNAELSRRRAEAVRDHLVRTQGLRAARFTTEGQGESRPVAPNATPDGADDPQGRQRNRRVEVLLAD